MKQDRYRNSRFEVEEGNEPWQYGGVSRKTVNTLGGLSAENRGHRSSGESHSSWDPGPFENDRASQWGQREGRDRSFDRGYRRSDRAVYEDVCAKLELSPLVDASEIEVTVTEGIVYMSGSVANRGMKRRAELEIENVSGVEEVQNQLRIPSGGEDLH
jgi:hypothetical protein